MFKSFIIVVLLSLNLYAVEKLKIGVLAYGTVNWELDVLKHNNLDKKNGFELEFVKLASKNAQNIALLSNSVDIIVNDWIWVNTQKTFDKDFVFYPYSKATGTVFKGINTKANSLIDIKSQQIGIAGGAYDKTWLILRAYSKMKYGVDLKDISEPIYASAPILYKKILDESLPLAINYWHFNAKLSSNGAKPLIEMDEVLSEMGINSKVSFIGWVFNKDKARKNKDLYNSFIKASHEAKQLLLKDEKQWNRIKPLMKVKNDEMFKSLINGYRKGVILDFNKSDYENFNRIFKILRKEGGKSLVGNSEILDEDIFWSTN